MDPSNQKTLILESPPYSSSKSFGASKICYLLSKDWWEKWCAYTGYLSVPTGDYPGKIDNSSISLDNVDPDAYIYLPTISWKRLKNWFNGGPAYKIYIINGSPDFFNIGVHVRIFYQASKFFHVPLSLTASEFIEIVCNKFKLEEQNWKFFIQYELGERKKIKNTTNTLKELNFCNNTQVVGEKKNRFKECVVPLDIKEEEEDEDLQNTISNSIGDYGQGASHTFKTQIIDLDSDHNSSKETHSIIDEYLEEQSLANLQRISEIKGCIFQSLNSEKVKIKLHSLKSLQRNLTQLYTQISNGFM